MKKYDSYKDSGIEWIGEIPSHWDVTRIKYKFEIGRGRVISNEDLVEDAIYPVYSSQTLNNGCLGYIETFDFNDKLITWTTDGANAGTVFLREGKFNCTNVCGTLKGKSDDVIPEFDYYFLQYATQFYKRPDTNGAKIMNNEMAVILSLKLSTKEQTAIAKYLDHKTTQIDKLIAKKVKFIQLLEEERIAVINQAVTKGLDTSVKMKDSGIEWLGEIPEHWEIVRLKYLSRIRYGLGQPPKQKVDGLPIIRATNIFRGIISSNNMLFVDPDDLPMNREPILKENDIIIVRSGAYTADSAIITKEWEGSVTGYDIVLTPLKVNPNLLAFSLLSTYLLDNQLFLERLRAAQPHLNSEEIGNSFFLLPPDEEQISIVQHIKKQMEKILILKERMLLEIELLKEYKTALISEVVTGKVDVRNEKIN